MKICSGSKYPTIKLFNFEKGSTNVFSSTITTQLPEATELFSSKTQAYTIFVPYNDQSWFLPENLLEGRFTAEQAGQIVPGHVVSGVYKAEDLTNGLELTTLANTTLTVLTNMWGVSLIVPLGGIANVVATDVQFADSPRVCGGSVAHVIDLFLFSVRLSIVRSRHAGQ